MNQFPLVICCTPFSNPDWKWFAPTFANDPIDWQFYYSIPKGFLEELIRSPNLAMIRTCREAVITAKQRQADLLITFDPRVSFWCAVFAQRLDVQIKHIAFAFNFPELPRGLKRRWMISAFQNISQFITYSTLEKQLYHDYFGIPLDRIQVRFWAVGVPKVEPETSLEVRDYICAVGGNGRDYRTLMAAMKQLPDIPLVIVVRPDNLKGLFIPPNVKVLVNISKGNAMNIIAHSRFMVLPLKGSQIPCGHVTLVAAMHLGKGFIITNSEGVSDYVIHDRNALTCEAFSPDALAQTIRQLWNDPDKCKKLGHSAKQFAQQYCSEESARQDVYDLLVKTQLIQC
jgi:glycosyltransferase involved in cell wall biosynthesis